MDDELDDYVGDRAIRVESHPLVRGLIVRLAGVASC